MVLSISLLIFKKKHLTILIEVFPLCNINELCIVMRVPSPSFSLEAKKWDIKILFRYYCCSQSRSRGCCFFKVLILLYLLSSIYIYNKKVVFLIYIVYYIYSNDLGNNINKLPILNF